ncbi:MAG: PD-(D/E)XK nuclease family protein [Treponema sp.]|nr:PD-(D/E)XK nuclease family protein [Treponema sp.]
MNILYVPPSEISHVIINNLKNDTVLFVFPTDIAASSWTDWIVSHPEESGVTSVPLERFTAWDTFKSSMMNAKVRDHRSIPSLLRKIFIRRLISENSRKASEGQPLFKSIINPVYAQNAYAFTDWIARILPSLEMWHKKYEVWLNKRSGSDSDEENQDYLTLYTRYKKYLDDNDLFEPSWIMPDFSLVGRTCIIFYPETLEDFSDYRENMEKAESVQLVMLPETTIRPVVSFYSNSRTELRAAALKIRSLVKNNDTTWSDIAVSVSDIDTWRPYIERELNLYCIPFIMRAGESYTTYSAGRIFREIQECVQNNFSYDSVRSLLLDGYIPWKEKELNQNLVREGSERKCICSYEENGTMIDSWERALASVNSGNTTERELRAYRELKKRITGLCSAATFRGIQTQWFAFRSDFLDELHFSDDANLILGRCLKVLSDLIDIEDNFLTPFQLSIPSPYSFFLNELENSIYQKQPGFSGVSVFPYRLSSCAQFKYQFVLDSSQTRLTVPYRSLSFLSRKKREELAGPDKDTASDAFVRLYAEKDTAFFSAAEQTFGGFSIPFSLFAKKDKNECENELRSLSDDDFIIREQDSFADDSVFPEKITEFQKNGFSSWKNKIAVLHAVYEEPHDRLKQKIKFVLCTNRSRNDNRPGVLHIAQTDLTSFYPCRRAWIFSQILKLKDDTLDTSLMEKYDSGSINHKILELFMKSYQEAGRKLPFVSEDGVFENEPEIRESLIGFAGEAFCSPEENFKGSPLVLTVLESQKEIFADTILLFLRTFCKTFGGYTVTGVEQWMSGHYENISDVSLTGRIDCILSDDNGDVSIIDYKNTAAAAPATADCIADSENRLADFQIPMYITLWNMNHAAGGVSAVENALFYTISDRKNRFIVQNGHSGRSGAVTMAEYAHTLECFSVYVKDFTDSVQSYNFAVDSERVEAYRDCRTCRFKSICRTAYISSGIRIPESQGDAT